MVLSKKRVIYSEYFEAKWNKKLAALKEYKRIFHHCLPPNQGEYLKLSFWVMNQRTAHKNGTLSQERQSKLNTIGFFSRVHDGSKWIPHYNRLVEFHRYHGHCNADTTDCAAAAARGFLKWLQTQRDDHKDGLLPAERKELLEKLGEPWTSVGGSTVDGSDIADTVMAGSTNSEQTTTLVPMQAKKPPVKRGRPKGQGGMIGKKKKPMRDHEKRIALDMISPTVEDDGDDNNAGNDEGGIFTTNSVYQAVSTYVNKRKDNKRKRILFDATPRKPSMRLDRGDSRQGSEHSLPSIHNAKMPHPKQIQQQQVHHDPPGNEHSLLTVHNAKMPHPTQLQQEVHHDRPGNKYSLLRVNDVTTPSPMQVQLQPQIHRNGQLQPQVHHHGQLQPQVYDHPGYSMVPYQGAVVPFPFHSFPLPTSNHHPHMVAPVVESSPAKLHWPLPRGTAYAIPTVDSNSPNSRGGMSWGTATPQQLFGFQPLRDPDGRHVNEML